MAQTSAQSPDTMSDTWRKLTEGGAVTSDTIKVQVKGGDSRCRGNGYVVPVDPHRDTWSEGNIPVHCVVHDPNSKILYWANATQRGLRAVLLRRQTSRSTARGLARCASRRITVTERFICRCPPQEALTRNRNPRGQSSSWLY
ncbi:DUF4365 domain-containing protein [Streptomyces cyaneofuscatus]|uniref:DUF4365 domain-containing protein n=1 Tax=Streptomyces cyaneofuscatus TaxID=66883 RepID=UPI00381909D5